MTRPNAMTARRALAFTRRISDNLDRHDAPLAASAIAFDAFLSLVPLLALFGSIVATLHQRGDLLLGPLLQNAPSAVTELAVKELDRLHDTPIAAIAPIVTIGFVWVSSAGLATAMGVCERMRGGTSRSWLARRAVAVAGVLASVAVVALYLGTIVLATRSAGFDSARFLGLGVPPLVIAALAAFFRISVPSTPGTARRLWPGAFTTFVLWASTSTAYGFYVARFARYITFYGSLASIAILLLWLWILALALLVGGEVNAALEAGPPNGQ